MNGGVPVDTVAMEIVIEDLQEWLELVSDDPDPLPGAQQGGAQSA